MRVSLFVMLVAAMWFSAGAALAQDVGASQQPVCCGATCCFLDGRCRGTGDENPRNNCEVCDPTMSQTTWTTLSGCTPIDAGRVDAGGGGGGGGGCSASAGASPSASLGVLALGMVAWALRRRRR
jgi:MYXO-CTERM domain-containing protein